MESLGGHIKQRKQITIIIYLLMFLFRVLQDSLSYWILIYRKWAVGYKLSCLFRKVPWRCMIKNLPYFNLAVPVGLITRIYIFLRINSRYEVRNSLNNTGLCCRFHISNCHLVRQKRFLQGGLILFFNFSLQSLLAGTKATVNCKC